MDLKEHRKTALAARGPLYQEQTVYSKTLRHIQSLHEGLVNHLKERDYDFTADLVDAFLAIPVCIILEPACDQLNDIAQKYEDLNRTFEMARS